MKGLAESADHMQSSMVSGPSQNAIYNLLLPPLLRNGLAHTVKPTLLKLPSPRDIPPVTFSLIPHVEAAAFRAYLSQAGSLYEEIQRLKLENEDSGQQVSRKDIPSFRDSKFDRLDEHTTRKDLSEGTLNTKETSQRVSRQAEPSHGWRMTSLTKRGQLAPTPLSTVPSVYFDGDFRLENPRTFDIVTEYAEVVRKMQSTRDSSKATDSPASCHSQPSKALSSNAILQEKISWYMDIVEVNLISSISEATAAFFAALASFHQLQCEVAASVAKIQNIRKNLAHLDSHMVSDGLQMINMRKRRDNLQILGESIEQLQCVLRGASHCEELVNSGQLDLAIFRISYVENLVNGTLESINGNELDWLLPNPFIRLTNMSQLHALRELPQRFALLRQRIGKGYEDRLREVIKCDLQRHLSSVPRDNTLARWASGLKYTQDTTIATSLQPSYVMNTEKLCEELLPILQGLEKSQYLALASTSLREGFSQVMNFIICQHTSSSIDGDDEHVMDSSMQANNQRFKQLKNSNILSRNLGSLGTEEAEAFHVDIYCEIGESLRRFGVQIDILLDIQSNVGRNSTNALTPKPRTGTSGSPEVLLPDLVEEHDLENVNQALNVSSLLDLAVGKSQSEIGKILQTRTDSILHLSLPDFLRHITLYRLFISECEAISENHAALLPGTMDKQIHEFITTMHQAKMQELASKMESEKWERINFTADGEVTLAHIIQSVNADPSAWLEFTNTTVPSVRAGDLVLQVEESAKPMIVADKKTPALAVIEEEQFSLIDSAAFALFNIEKYTVLLISIPEMASAISKDLIDYVKLYNSRTQQLILGAGAKRTVGLASINTKHLALASQSLSFFIALIPYLRDFVLRRPPVPDSTMADYGRLKRLLQDHQKAINDKLIEMMELRATHCIRAMAKTRWDSREEVEKSVSPHIETFTKETLTLQRVLSKYLPDSSVGDIIGSVFVIYRQLWAKTFERAVVRTEAGQARLMRDAELLVTKLGKMDGAGEFGAHIISIMKAKEVGSQSDARTNMLSGEGKPT